MREQCSEKREDSRSGAGLFAGPFIKESVRET